jgi:ubiquitin-conjugating enzyme E2 variant
METTAIVVVAALAGEAARRLLTAVDGGNAVWFVLGALAGYVGADLVTGLVHWAADTYGTEQTPVLGPNFVGPFRSHHSDPDGITRHDVIETNGNSCIVAAPVLGGALWWLPGPAEGDSWLFAWTVLLATSVAAVATNQFHKWAHMVSPPAPVRVLQQCGVILARHHHLIHHAAPYRTHYSITTGWTNESLRRTRAHETLETLLARFGVHRTA